MKKRIISVIALVLAAVMALSSCGAEIGVDETTGNITVNGNDTGVSSLGTKGEKGEQGDKGAAGDALTLTSFEKTATDGNVDIYTLTFSDGTTAEWKLANGKDGTAGAAGAAGADGKDGATVTVTELKKTSSNGNVDTYTVLFSNGTNYTFNITNGGKGETGDKGEKGDKGDVGDDLTVSSFELVSTSATAQIYKITYSDGSEAELEVPLANNGDKGDKGDAGDKGDDLTVSSFGLVSDGDEEAVYKLVFSDGSEKEITLSHGLKGEKGDKGETGDAGVSITEIKMTSDGENADVYTVYYSDNSTYQFTVNTYGETGVTITDVVLAEEGEKEQTYKLVYSDSTEAVESSYSFKLTKSGDARSQVLRAYDAALSSGGFTGTEEEWVKNCVEMLAGELTGKGSIIGVKTFGYVVKDLLDAYDSYFASELVEDVLQRTVDLTVADGYRENTKLIAHATYKSNSNKIAVSKGETLSFVGKTTGRAYPMRFLIGYKLESDETGWYCSNNYYETAYTFTDPCIFYSNTEKDENGNKLAIEVECPAYVIGTWTSTQHGAVEEMVAKITADETRLYIDLSSLDAVAVLRMAYTGGADIGGAYGSYISEGDSNVLTSTVLGQQSLVVKAETLAAGTDLKLTETGSDGDDFTAKYSLFTDSTISFYCNVDELADGEEILVGHTKFPTYSNGEYLDGVYASCWLIIKSNSVQVATYYTSSNHTIAKTELNKNRNPVIYTFDGFTIKDFVQVSIEVNYGNTADIRIVTNGGNWYKTGVAWEGRHGDIVARGVGTDLTNVSLRWYLEALEEKIWLFGDSFFNFYSSRWPCYLLQNGYVNNALWGYPGMNTETAIADFKWAVEELGYTPQYVVWCMGMNNPDTLATGAINKDWLNSTAEFLEICEEKGITPILCTIPSTPTQLNEPKNVWIREWSETTGGRYVDFAHAVGGDKYDEALKSSTAKEGYNYANRTGYDWYDGMLGADCVHPATPGAEALYDQVIADFPEITDVD